MRLAFLFIVFPLSLFSQVIHTFYGEIDVQEPVLLELIVSESMQRLKKIHQYGISYYVSKYNEEFYRYEHSLGVFALLRLKGCSLEEQIAGLLHDVSHTVFSHVGDYVFAKSIEKENFDAYQDDIHLWYLKKCGIEKILQKYGYTPEKVFHKSGKFIALEQKIPNLSADRLDYNLQGAYHRGDLTKKEIAEIVDDLKFQDGKWISTKPKLLKKMCDFALKMTEYCWGSAENFIQSKWFAEIITKGLELKKITFDEIHFGTDDEVMKKLREIKNPYIQKRFALLKKVHEMISESQIDPEIVSFRKFRGVDPWIKKNGKIQRLTLMDSQYALKYQDTKKRMAKGLKISLKKPLIAGSEAIFQKETAQ